MTKHEKCHCCKNYKKFKIDENLLHAIHSGDSVFFVGSGVSTESDKVFPYTFYENIKDETKKASKDDDIKFSKLMSLYCEQNGSKVHLLDKIKDRLDYIESFPELYRKATEFHATLATIPMIKNIITTNWDDYFEKECAAIPFVDDKDMVFWDNPKRKVLKIHGSINNLGSIIATEEGY